MAVTTIQANNKLVQYRRDITREYVRENLFSPYYGDGVNAIIRNLHDPKKGGEQINVPLVNSLSGSAISTGTLTGNEEAIDNYGFRMWVDWARHAVRTTDAEEQKDSADIFGEAKPLLSDWGKELQRDELILALHAIPSESAPANLGSTNGQRVNGILYSAANATQKNGWTAANEDRVLFGDSVANYSGTHATALGAIDPTMTLNRAAVSLMKRMAKNASPKIRPYRTKGGKEYFVLFAGSYQFRDLKADLETVNIDARPRNVDQNPIFQDGDLIYDGVIIREIPEMTSLVNVAGAGTDGAEGSIDVAPVFMCGQMAAAVAWAKMPTPTFLKDDDYQFVKGAGIKMCYGIGKIAKDTDDDLKDWGVFTGYFANVADA